MKIILVLMILLVSFPTLVMETFAQGLNLPNDFGVTVYPLGGLFFARTYQNDILGSSDTPDDIIKTALARGGEIFIAGGTYNLSKDFSGFNLKSGTHLKLASDAKIIVPSGYRGYVFRFVGVTSDCVLDGGTISEANPVQRGWIGIMMQAGSIYFNRVENMVITNPYIVIDFNGTEGHYINANTFVNIQGFTFVRGIEFDFKGSPLHGIYGNTFRDSQFEGGPMTTYGIKDIKHDNNAFYNVQVWDLPHGAISSSIDPTAHNTIIIGGQMTHYGFVDNGENTIILDAWHNNLPSNSTLIKEIISGTLSQQNTSTLPSHSILNFSIPQHQVTGGTINGNNAKLGISAEHPSEINIIGTISDPNGGKVLLKITAPDGVIEQNEAYVSSDGTFYFPMIFDKNSMTGQYKIEGQYQNSNLGILYLIITSEQVPTANVPPQPDLGTVTPTGSNTTDKAGIKNNANLWSQGLISDKTFGNSIQFLLKTGIIQGTTSQMLPAQSLYIPTWFKNNASLWATGQISDKDYYTTIQYLVNNGIMKIPFQQSN